MIQTLPYGQAVDVYGPAMARALDVCQEAYTVRICAKSDVVEKPLSTNMLFVRVDASWSGIMTSVCGDVLQTCLFGWVPSSMNS